MQPARCQSTLARHSDRRGRRAHRLGRVWQRALGHGAGRAAVWIRRRAFDVDTGLTRFGLTNLYSYVGEDPINLADPTGRYFAWLTPDMRAIIDRLELNPAIGLSVLMMDMDSRAMFTISQVPESEVGDPSGAVTDGSRAHDGLACHASTTFNLAAARRRMEENFGLPINADQVVAHEVGHAFYWYSHPQGVPYSDAADDQTSLDWENAVRDLPYYRQRHYP